MWSSSRIRESTEKLLGSSIYFFIVTEARKEPNYTAAVIFLERKLYCLRYSQLFNYFILIPNFLSALDRFYMQFFVYGNSKTEFCNGIIIKAVKVLNTVLRIENLDSFELVSA